MRQAAAIGDNLCARHLAWLRYLGADSSRQRLSQPAAKRVLAELTDVCRERLRAALEGLAANPVVVADDGATRCVELCGAIRYTMDRRAREFRVCQIARDGVWFDVSPNAVNLDTFLCHRRWRVAVAGGLWASVWMWLGTEVGRLGEVPGTRIPLALVDTIVADAWNGMHVMRRLRYELPTKRMRCMLRAAMALDADLLELARACKLANKWHMIHQGWLTFVWRHQERLRRIRQQTPNLLKPTAEFLFRFGARHRVDPVKSLADWLGDQGIAPACFRVLAHRSARPFQCVTRRWHYPFSLDALALALAHGTTPNGAAPLRPALCRALYDLFEPTTQPSRMRELLAKLPPVFFARAQAESWSRAPGFGLQEFLRTEYLPVADWIQSTKVDDARSVFTPAGDWNAWVRAAHELDRRQKASRLLVRWECGLPA